MGPKIGVILGSASDEERLKEGFTTLDEMNIKYDLKIASAHRNPDKVKSLCKKMEKEGVKVIIAAAGLACALPGFIASYVNIPVIGVPLEGGILDGLDSLLSIVQVPKGLGLVSSGTNKRGFINAVIFALSILSLNDKEYHSKLIELKKKFKS
ncbi:MAG: AIR carboxylase family protein [Candidatus Omnitrophota bacterium]